MRSIRIVLAIALVAILSACSVSTMHTASPNTNDVYETTIFHSPMIADLEVQEQKITEEYECKISWSATDTDKEIEGLKNYATAEALRKSSADILIEATYEIHISPERSHNSNIIKVVVTGYPATYKNFRNVSPQELELIEKTARSKMIFNSKSSDPTLYISPE